MLVQNPKLREAYVNKSKPSNWERYDVDEKALYFYFSSLLGLLERVWYSYRYVKWQKEEEWKQWRNWIRELATNETFIHLIGDDENLYDPSFIEEVKQVIVRPRERITPLKKGIERHNWNFW